MVEHGELGQGGGGLRRGQLTLLEQVLEAHGGLEAWTSAGEIEAEIRSGGFALASKGVARPFRHYEATVTVHEPRTVIAPYPRPGSRGVFEGDSVRIEPASGGEALAERRRPRDLFPECGGGCGGTASTRSTSPATPCGTTSLLRSS
jgi:hypothetical protein